MACFILCLPQQPVSPRRACTRSSAPSSRLPAQGRVHAACSVMGTNQSSSIPMHSPRINLLGVYSGQSVSFLVCLMLVRHNHPTSDRVFHWFLKICPLSLLIRKLSRKKTVSVFRSSPGSDTDACPCPWVGQWGDSAPSCSLAHPPPSLLPGSQV